MNDLTELRKWSQRVAIATLDAHRILAQYEQAPSRVVILEKLLNQLAELPDDVKNYFEEAITCLELNLLRAATVMSWAGHFYVFSEYLYQKHLIEIRELRTKWKLGNLEEFKENTAEAQILDLGKEVGFISNSQLRVLHGQLSTRNQCAHPTLFKPSMNVAIGFVDSMIGQTRRYINQR